MLTRKVDKGDLLRCIKDRSLVGYITVDEKYLCIDQIGLYYLIIDDTSNGHWIYLNHIFNENFELIETTGMNNALCL